MTLGLRSRWVRVSGAIVLLLAASVALVPGFRRYTLQSAGWALVANDPLERVDIVVVTVDSGGAGILEAANHTGVAETVGLFADQAGPADFEFIRHGIKLEAASAKSAHQLEALGVSSTELLPGTVTGTETKAICCSIGAFVAGSDPS